MKFYVAIAADGAALNIIRTNADKFPKDVSVKEFDDLDSAYYFLRNNFNIQEIDIKLTEDE